MSIPTGGKQDTSTVNSPLIQQQQKKNLKPHPPQDDFSPATYSSTEGHTMHGLVFPPTVSQPLH